MESKTAYTILLQLVSASPASEISVSKRPPYEDEGSKIISFTNKSAIILTKYVEGESKKVHKLKYWLSIKNPQFLINHHETCVKLNTDEVVTLTKFQVYRTKTADFLLLVNFGICALFLTHPLPKK